MKAAIIVIILIILAGGGYYFYKTHNTQNAMMQPNNAMMMNSNETTNSSKMMQASPSGQAMMNDEAGVKTFTVEGKNFSFAPSTITVNKGDKVKIVFKNTGGFHDFRIDEYKIATPRIQGGAEASVEFIADKAGTFDYYCSVGNHRAMGMQGTLTVK